MNNPKFNQSDIIERIKTLYNFRYNREMAKHFNLQEEYISKFKNGSKQISLELIDHVKNEKSVSLEWLLYGVRPTLFDEVTKEHIELGVTSGILKAARFNLLPKSLLMHDDELLEGSAKLIAECIELRVNQKEEVA